MSEHINEQSSIKERESEGVAKDKKRVTGFINDAGKNALRLAASAKAAVVNTIDQNGDGKLDLKDFATKIGQMGDRRDMDRLEKEYNTLGPIFKETINEPEFVLPKLIRISEIDKKHAESKTCESSIGYKSEHDGVQILTVYPKYIDLFRLQIYPNTNSGVYYVDPCDRDHYIALDEYYKFLRLKKVNELQEIAQALGARHFKVTYAEQESSDTKKKVKGSFKAKTTAQTNLCADIQQETGEKALNRIKVAAEMDCPGHEPTEPSLKYLKGDPNIEGLIKMRMSKNAPIHQKVSVNLMSMSGIKVKDAAKIDGALSALHFGAEGSIQKEAQSEAKTILEYEIDY